MSGVNRRSVLTGAVAAVFAESCSGQGVGAQVDVTAAPYHADPTGVRNSTKAFQMASQTITRLGGGKLIIPPGRYKVGIQRAIATKDWAFEPEPIILIRGCLNAVEIVGPGATLFCEDGLRYGSFDPATGRPFSPILPFTDTSYRASPYWAMIALFDNLGAIIVTGLELDGGSAGHRSGGPWNDTGIQIGSTGIEALGNHDVTIKRVHSHHHALDGVQLGFAGLSPTSPPHHHALVDCRLEDNGRQGLSWVGGNSLTVSGCSFVRSGRGQFSTSPAAGVDLEPENSVCINARFINCEFSDNAGVGMLVHPSGVCENHHFANCRFIGTTTWAAWPAAPASSFVDCTFVGGVTNAHASPDFSKATRFSQCHFTSDPKRGPGAKVYSQNYLTVEMDQLQNVLFDKCRFDSPASASKGLIYANGGFFMDCTFRQAGAGAAVIRGRFAGRNEIVTAGTVEFSSSPNMSAVILRTLR